MPDGRPVEPPRGPEPLPPTLAPVPPLELPALGAIVEGFALDVEPALEEVALGPPLSEALQAEPNSKTKSHVGLKRILLP